MNLFYSPELIPTAIGTETIHVTLNEEESSHAVRVLRMKTGEKLFLSDGRGMFYEAEIISDNAKKCKLKILRTVADTAKRNFHLTIAIAPTKSIDRFEWFLEKATEIGCDDILPISCKHSERIVLKAERLNKVIISAMKQCLKSQLPALNEIKTFKKFIEETKNSSAQKFIGHIPELDGSEFPPKNPQGKSLQSICKKTEDVLIAIGPEGGFSEEEVAFAVQNGFSMISLGNSRLRVETAGVRACSIINAINDF